MNQNGRPRRRLEAPSAPTSLHEITRRYYATAIALAKAMGLPMSETFLQAHRESISCCFIESGRAGVRLPPAVHLPPLVPGTPVPPQPEPDHDPLPPGEASPNGAVSDMGATVEADDVPDVPPPPDPEPTPLPTRIPTGDGWPCSGYEIATLKPSQLHLVLARAGFRAHNDTGVMPLLAALQVEREQRLARGRKAVRSGVDLPSEVE